MSKKSFFKGLGKPKAKEPRALDEIRTEYGQEAGKAGQLQYQIYALNQDLERLNQRLVSLNYEAAERQKMDSVKTEVKQEVVNEQV